MRGALDFEGKMRARNVKPGFFSNEHLLGCDPLARILFVGLWCLADREGRLQDRPRQIGLEVFPGESVSVDALLDQLAGQTESDGAPALIVRYCREGRRYIQILNFLKHQRPHSNEQPSEIPPWNENPPEKAEPLSTKVESTSHQGEKDFPPRQPSRARVLNPESLILNPEDCVPNGTLSGNLPDAPPASPPFAEIIAYFNAKTGKRYRANTQATKKHIKARWSEGWRIEDFKRVIDVKCEKWATDPKMIDYLRPETLFGTKFESYLNETRCRDGPRYDPKKPDWVRELEEGGGR